MIYAVWVPLLMPFLAVPAARRLAELLAPRQAVRLLAAAAVILGGCSTAALGLLVVAGALRLPAVAALGRLIHPPTGDGPVGAVAAVAAASLIGVCATALVRTVLRQYAELRAARRLVGGTARTGELAVLRDAGPAAYALPGRPGRIVVTTGMLRALDPGEREALFAHERAHLAGRHHLFLGAAELAALCHPSLRGLRAPLGYALERCADEAAAGAVGDRSLAARAIGRAALAAHGAPAARPSVVLAADAGPVPRRVAALLSHRPTGAVASRREGRTARAIAAALLVCVALSAAGALEAATDLHTGIEVAQGETGPH
ncbi:M56 family metallopeptidase [Streptomyces sp. NPDC051320]|uniref:M56 family metallopeptidase n=1 Tax=Streptomyces sp. NPDC051320 TaxID=3154644 RepID=UPI00343AF21E